MAEYQARVMDPDTGAEGRYPFEGPDDMLERMGAARVCMHFLENVDRNEFPHQHVNYDLNAASKSHDGTVVTGMGTLIFENGAHLPFVALISRA